MENHDSMLLGWYPSTPAYPPVDLPPGPQGPSTSNLVRLPPGDYPDLRTPIIHPHEPGDPAPATSAAVTTVHQSVSCAPSDRVMTSATHAVHLSHIVQPHVTQVTHLNAQIAQPQVLQQMVTSAGVTSGGHTLVQMVGVPAGSVAGNVNLPIGGTLQTTQGSLIHVIEAPIEGPPFRCTECDHVAKTKRMLKRHLATVHSQERNYACQYCDAKFKLSGHLNEHLAGKHNIGKCTCDKCGKLFSTPFRLKQHTLLAHEDFRLECPYECEYKTKYQQQLNKHIRCKHLGIDPQATTGKRKCTLCDFEGYCLAAHVRAVHTKEKPYKCQHCDRAFSDRNNQRAHEHRVHAKDRLRHKCDYCDQTFYTPGRLREHIAVRHTHEHTHLCENCGFSTAVERTYLRHRKSNCNYHKTPLQCNRCDFTTHIPFQFKSHKETCEATVDEDLKKVPTRRKVRGAIDVAEVHWEEGDDVQPSKTSKKALKVRISLPARKRAAAAAKTKKQRIVWTTSDEEDEAMDFSIEGGSSQNAIEPITEADEALEGESQEAEEAPQPSDGNVLMNDVDDIQRHLKQQKLKKQAIERSIRNIKKQSRISSKKRRPIRGQRRKVYTEDSDSDYEPEQSKQPILERRESSRRVKVPVPEFVEVVDAPLPDHNEICTEPHVESSVQSPPPPSPRSPDEVTIDAEEIEVFACTQCQTFFIEKSKLAEHIMDAHVSKVKIKVNSDEWMKNRHVS